MSDTSPLMELANFSGKSELAANEPKMRRRTLSAISGRLLPKPHRRSVGELLAVVLVLSARTRRLVLPPARVEVDVFTPKGGRAVRLYWGPAK